MPLAAGPPHFGEGTTRQSRSKPQVQLRRAKFHCPEWRKHALGTRHQKMSRPRHFLIGHSPRSHECTALPHTYQFLSRPRQGLIRRGSLLELGTFYLALLGEGEEVTLFLAFAEVGATAGSWPMLDTPVFRRSSGMP
jgi:hypothetical protein